MNTGNTENRPLCCLVTDSRGNTTTYTFDTARGTQTSVTDAEENRTTYDYNADNDRLESVTSSYMVNDERVTGSTVSYAYDNVGALNKITSPSGTEYYLVYDDFGNLYSTSVGARVLSENHYNTTRGLLTYTEYGNGHRIDYSYDTLDRVTQRMYNNGIKVNLRYDKHGNLYEKIDGFTETTYRYSYDLTGRIIGIKGSNGIGLDYIYDSLNRVSKYATKFNGITNTTEFVYGNSTTGQLDGILYGVKLNGQQKLTYAYDQLARMQNRTIATTTPFETNYTYLEGGTQGTTTTMVKSVENDSGTYEYSYDQLGNITEIKLNGVVYESYEYDHLGQLTFVARGGTDFYEYYYDDGGNLREVYLNGVVIKRYEYGDATWNDLLTKFNDDVIEYDDIGNPLQYRDGFNFSWSNGRQLTSVSKNGQTFNYLYDADGLRARKSTSDGVTDYYWLDGVLLGQKTGNDYITYLYDDNGTPYGIICNDTYYYYVFNAQGDVVGIIDESGTQVVQYDYSAWGEVLAITGSGADTIGQLNPIRYRGYYYDNETGFYYLQSRYYDPVTQRFLNADGLVSTGQGILGYNMFAYCNNSPISYSDDEGNLPKWMENIKECVKNIVKKATDWVDENIVKPIKEPINKSAEKHYSRNTKNKVDCSVEDIVNNYTKVSEWGDQYHENTSGNQGSEAKYNDKYLSPNGGHIEVIICNAPNIEPYIVDEFVDNSNMGTYNYASNDSFVLTYFAEHFCKDMVPYYLYGNTREDSYGCLKWALE